MRSYLQTVLGCGWFAAGVTMLASSNQEAQYIAAFVGCVIGAIWMASE